MSSPVSGVSALAPSLATAPDRMPAATAGQVQGANFQTVLRDALTETAGNIRAAETASVAGIEGRMDTRQVVDAVMAAEHSLQTAIAVRDKIVSAYLDLARMQI